MPAFKTLVYSPDCEVLISTKNGQVDVSRDLVRGTIQRSGEGVSYISLTLTNKKLRYTGTLRRMDRVIVRMRRIGVWITVFTGYLNSVPVLNLYPGLVTVSASCTLKRLKYTYWDPGLDQSAQLFDQLAADVANGGENKDAGLGFMLKNILIKVGGWDENSVVVQDFPTTFVDYLAKGREKYKDSGSAGLAQFKKLFDYDESTGAATGSSTGGAGGATMGAATEGQQAHARAIHEASIERGMGVEGTLRALMTGLVESEIRILANTKVPESYNFPHEGEGSDGTSCGIFQQQQNGAWGTLEQNMNAKASAGLFLNAMLRIGDWKAMERGASCQRVQGSALPDKYAKREADAQSIITTLGLTDTGAGAQGSSTPASPAAPAPNQGKPNAPAAAPATGQGALIDSNTAPPLPSRMGSEAHFQPDTVRLVRVVALKWPELQTIGGWRADGGGYNDHPSGRAADIMIPNNGSPEGIKLGTDIMNFLHANAGAFGLEYTIWRQEYWAASGDRNQMEDRGSPTQNHFDHVHATVVGNAGTGGMLDGTTSGAAPGAAAGGSSATSTFQNKLAKNIFGYLFDPLKYINETSTYYKDDRASVNDEPLMDTIGAVCKARMCKYMSAPTGEFVAYYPDYFGIDGVPAKLDLEDIELKNLSVQANDDNIVTHMFTSGSYQFQATGTPSDLQWLSTAGVATVEDAWLFDRLTAASLIVAETSTAQEFLERFGIRPLREEYSSIIGTNGNNAGIELMQAAQRFMQKWAEQSATNVELTFMPELFPGMRVNLVGHDVTVYVSAVTHNFDYSGGGFSTTATIMAPSRTSAISTSVNEAGK